MPDPAFIKRQQAKRAIKRNWLCWASLHWVFAKEIVVTHGVKRGLCVRCLERRVQREGLPVLASYWTRDWPATWIGPHGTRQTYAVAQIEQLGRKD